MKEDNSSLSAFRNPLAWIRHSRTALSRDEIQWHSYHFQRANQYPFNPWDDLFWCVEVGFI